MSDFVVAMVYLIEKEPTLENAHYADFNLSHRSNPNTQQQVVGKGAEREFL
jgi:hypothetical protein